MRGAVIVVIDIHFINYTAHIWILSWGVMKMGNILLGAEIEPTSFAVPASVLTIKPTRLPYAITLPTATSLSRASVKNYYTCPSGIMSFVMLTITYIEVMTLHGVGSTTTECTACSGSQHQRPECDQKWKYCG